MREALRLFREARGLLSRRAKRFLAGFVVAQLLLALLDTAALFAIATIFVAGVDAESVAVVGSGRSVVLVIVLFTVRSVLSTVVTWRMMPVLSAEEVRIGHSNLVAYVGDPGIRARGFDLNDLYNAVDRGPGALMSGTLFACYSIIAELLAGLVILLTLVYLAPVTAITTTVFFVGVAVLQHRMLSGRTMAAGNDVVSTTQAVYDSLGDSYALGKVLSVMPSRSFLPHMLAARQALSRARLRSSFLSTLPRYFMELVLAFGLAVVAATTLLFGGEGDLIRSITVFAVAGFRLLPIINRAQSLVLLVLATLPSASLIRMRVPARPAADLPAPTSSRNILEFDDVSFSYHGTHLNAVTGITLSFEPGRQYALIGPSGAGKTTLVDLAVGVLPPTAGSVRRQPGCRVGYVPQDTHVAKLSMGQNIALEWSDDAVDPSRVGPSVQSAELSSMHAHQLDGSVLGGSSLSGGQKQRVGLARALYREPTLLFLDEVTSALDPETEDLVMRSIHDLRGKATVVIVAHRLTTVQHADEVIYLDGGRVLGTGTFDALRRELPQLQRQIELGTLNLLD